MDLVINEWFANYCRVDETEENKTTLIKFLDKLIQGSDKIYIKRPSPFLNKIERYSKEFQTHRDTYSITVINAFRKRILLDSKRCVFVDGECELEEVILDKLKAGNYSSDTYLFEAASKTESKTIITTDDKLCKQMHNVAGYQVINLKDFLPHY